MAKYTLVKGNQTRTVGTEAERRSMLVQGWSEKQAKGKPVGEVQVEVKPTPKPAPKPDDK
ncbi:hypothetical protein [Nesterenkonia suensis]